MLLTADLTAARSRCSCRAHCRTCRPEALPSARSASVTRPLNDCRPHRRYGAEPAPRPRIGPILRSARSYSLTCGKSRSITLRRPLQLNPNWVGLGEPVHSVARPSAADAQARLCRVLPPSVAVPFPFCTLTDGHRARHTSLPGRASVSFIPTTPRKPTRDGARPTGRPSSARQTRAELAELRPLAVSLGHGPESACVRSEGAAE